MEQGLPEGVVREQEGVLAKGVRVRGRMGGMSPGAGPSGNCVCPNCGAQVSHQVEVPCYHMNCPQYGVKMGRG